MPPELMFAGRLLLTAFFALLLVCILAALLAGTLCKAAANGDRIVARGDDE